MRPRYIPAVIIMIGLMVGSFYLYNWESRYIQDMSIARGIIIGHGAGSTSSTKTHSGSKSMSTQAIVKFSVNDVNYRVKGRAMGFPKWVVGEEVDVYYNMKDPREARINRFDELYFFTLLCLFFLSGGLLFAVINFSVYKVTGKVLS